MMQILPGQVQSGSIVLNENLPALFIGRTLVVTVLSAPKSGRVLVSMFGKRLLVDTTMALHKGQVINLKVHALNPRVVLKPADPGAEVQSTTLRDMGNAVCRLVGSYGEKQIDSFLFQEIIRELSSHPGKDTPQAHIAASLIEQVLQHPQALAHLLIPLVDRDSRGSAKVTVERDEEAYILNFGIETDRLGSLECTARVDQGIDVEIRTPSEDTAGYLGEHIHELKASLEHFGVRYIKISQTVLTEQLPKGVDVLV